MANVVIWVVILFTASCVSQTIVSNDDVACADTGATVTLQLAGIDPRPTKVIINGAIADDACKLDIPSAGDTSVVSVPFGKCGANRVNSVTSFNLYIVQHPEYLSVNDLFIPVTCTDVNVNIGVIEHSVGVNEATGDPKTNVNEIPHDENPTDITMIFENRQGRVLTDSSPPVDLGDTITLKLTATDPVSYDVTRCTVESTDATDALIGAYDIITGWCANDGSPFSNFNNVNDIPTSTKTSTATFNAFRLVGQGTSKSLLFKCYLKWCATDNGACKHPAGDACNTRRRRSQIDDIYERYGTEKTVTSSLRVNLPGIATAGTNTMGGNDYIVKLAVILSCGLRYVV